MAKITGPLDGQVSNYAFGPRDMHEAWRIAAPSLRRAIRLFRVGALFPEKYIDKKTGLIPIWAKVDQNYTEITQIPVEGQEDLDPRMLTLLGSVEMPGQEVVTALAPAGAMTGLRSAGRSELEDKTRKMNKQLAALEEKKRELEQLKRELQAELNRRMEQIWIIELFLGSHEEVTVLREGEPAPIDTPISVRQAVLCMDEEIAVHDWLRNPDRIGKFDYQNVESFDRWLVERPEALESICPWKKGIVGLRVRRKRLDRGPASDIFQAMYQQDQEDADRMTYLLIRNGERLFRLWVDVNLWPRLFPSMADSDAAYKDTGWRSDQERAQRMLKHQVAGLIAVQGILERSELLHPVPAGINVFDASQAESNFQLVRDGEETVAIRDDSDPLAKIVWEDIRVKDPSSKDEYARILAVKGYKTWLREQLGVGVRVLYTGTRYGSKDDKLEDRTGIRSLSAWPEHGEVYTLSASHERGWRGPLEFLYMPNQSVLVADPDSMWRGDYQERERKRRVSFRCYHEEVVPFDFLSWRVLEHLIKDRSQREHYGDFFRTAFNWWRIAKAEAERERPFIDLVLSRCGADLFDEKERARCERLLRWWKIKTKEHRTLGTDEAKALRMIEAAFKRGDDHDNDPEAKLLNSQT